MEMEASPPSSLRHKLRATLCCCFGAGDRAQWRRHAAVGEFRYDPLSYALNFDEGADDVDQYDYFGADGDSGLVYRSFSSRLASSPPPPPRTTTPGVAVA